VIHFVGWCKAHHTGSQLPSWDAGEGTQSGGGASMYSFISIEWIYSFIRIEWICSFISIEWMNERCASVGPVCEQLPVSVLVAEITWVFFTSNEDGTLISQNARDAVFDDCLRLRG